MFDKVRKQLLEEGTVVLDIAPEPFTIEDWRILNKEVREMPYSTLAYGDTDESMSIDVTRIKIAQDDDIKNREIFRILHKAEFKSLIKSITGMDEYVIDRCQAHIYREGDFIAAHRDKNSCETYEYVVSIVLDSDYEGGGFVVYKKNGEKQIFHPKANQILLSSCDFYHEVLPVTKGERRVLLSFIQPVQSALQDTHKVA